MTTIKIKFRASAVAGKKGTLFYQLIHQRRIRQIATSLHLYPEEWNLTKQRVEYGADNQQELQHQIDQDIRSLKSIVHLLESTTPDYTLDQVVNKFTQRRRQKNVLAFIRLQIAQLESENRLGTARNYHSTLLSFSQFLKDKDIPFELFTETLVYEYNAYLKQRGIVRNSISFYMRVLRSIYNKAQKLHYVNGWEQPFQNVYTGIDRTRKRAIDEKRIAEIYRLKLPRFSHLDLARDLFIFSYCTRGMAFIDIIHLKKINLQEGMICYHRQKTSQPLYIKVEQSIQKIIEKYAEKTRNSPYLFPILKGDSEEMDYKRYQKALNRQNRLLKKIGNMLSENCILTSYVARHSWATAARNHNIPLSVISAGLGHTSEKTTLIYLSALENSRIDSANLEIINNLL